MKRVFISYSRRQKTFADRLARDLSDAGLDVWIDFRQIEGGERWRDEIFKGLEKSEGVVFCLSPDAIKSEWCRREVAIAYSQNKPIYPAVIIEAFDLLDDYPETKWMTEIQYILLQDRYEQGITELITALSGKRDPYDDIDVSKIPNPFKGLEAFQQTDAHIFFGREDLTRKLLEHLSDDMQNKSERFLAVVGASGSGKSSLVRAGVIPALRTGKLPNSDKFPIAIVTPGASPIESLTARLMPLLPSSATMDEVYELLNQNPQSLNLLVEKILSNTQDATHMVLVIDQFEEVFTRASEDERERFIKLLHTASTLKTGHTLTIITMRADFFGNLSKYPQLAELFEQENMVIATEMTAANLRRSIEGPAEAVGLSYDPGLVDRILDDVRQQPGSLPLLQYALKELYLNREGRRLTLKAYEEIGGVQRALAQHAEDIYDSLNPVQQDIMRRVLLRLVEVSDNGEATRRKVARTELNFRGIADEAVQEVIDLLTAADSRLLIASREIPKVEQGAEEQPTIWLEVSHEALIRQWDRFKSWVAADVEELRHSGELLKAARDWERANRDAAYLLTGNRLTRAQGFLEIADLNPLQRAFIQASTVQRQQQESAEFHQQERELELQKRSASRLRAFVIALAIFSIAVLGLLGLVAFSLSEAQRQRDVAERQSGQARSLALAANALRVSRDNENDLSLRLALTANEVTEPPIEAQRALAELAYLPGTRFLFTGHNAAVTSLTLNHEGTLALSGSDDHTIILWDLNTRTMVRQMGIPVLVTTNATSSALTNSTSEGTIGHTNRITSSAISPDGTHALSAGADNQLIYWDLTTGAEVWRKELNSPIRSIAFNPVGQSVAVGNAQGNISIIDLNSPTGAALTSLVGREGAVLSLAYSADGAKILFGTLGNDLILWDIATGERRDFVGHTASVSSVALSTNGQYALSGSFDDSIILWNVNDATRIATLVDANPQQVNSVAFNEDSTRILSADKLGRIIVWDIAEEAPVHYLYVHDEGQTVVAYAHDDIAVSGSAPDHTLRLLDTEGDEVIIENNINQREILSVAVSPDGTRILSGGDEGFVTLSDQQTGALIPIAFNGHTDAVNAVAFSPDGARAVSASSDSLVIVWDAATGSHLIDFTGHQDEVTSVAFSANGQFIASGDVTGTLLLWDANTGQLIHTLSSPDNEIGHTDTVYSVAFSPDSSLLLSVDGEAAIILWDVTAGTLVRRFGTGAEDERHNGSIYSVAFSPDGTRALTGSDDYTMILWDVATGASIRRFLEQDNWVKSVAFSPDGRIAVSGAYDSTVRLWDVETGTEIRRYGGVVDSLRINSVAFNPDGHSVVSGDVEGNVTQWRVFTVAQELVDWTVVNRFVPELTQDQCDLFRIEPPCP
jgi:WD40 repeat protein